MGEWLLFYTKWSLFQLFHGIVQFKLIFDILFVNGGATVSVLAWSAVDRGIELRGGQTKDYENDSCCLSDKHEATSESAASYA
jgi:hypothetical protein